MGDWWAGFTNAFECMEPKRDGTGPAGEQKQDNRYSLLCMSVDCSGARKSDGPSNKVSVGGDGVRRGMTQGVPASPARQPLNGRNDMTNTPGTPVDAGGLPGGVGVVFKAGPIGSGPVVKGIVPGGSADMVGGVEVGDELLEIDGGQTLRLPAMELAGRLIGPVGSKMEMVFGRKTEEGTIQRSTVTLERTRIR